ncbi:hypothetical protein [Colwellia psychrerythraea]|uniref:Uncharacterized protein n=1 Tax=Colwellia psychrerythraea TaxID=28229 RepID=A0A099KZH5_COLPS|nr:hypothetical protein [Colwellia psychrerythraea]KGJ96016.1 hypothetical protein GAB14E_1767 [Colwellia psychrerythraea]
MSQCIEIAVFEVAKSNLERLLEVSETLFAEINAVQDNILAHQISTKIDLSKESSEEAPAERTEKSTAESEEDLGEVCWHLTWANTQAVQASKSMWSTYSSSAEIERLVGKKLYYGHFAAVITKQ